MIKNIDERLEMLNEENYDVQFDVKNEEELIEDIMDYFDIEEDEVNGYYPDDEEIKGNYVYSSLEGNTTKLEEALDYEFGQALINIEFYDQDTQEEILDYFYNDVEYVKYKFEINEKEYENSIEFDEAKEYLIKTALKELEEEIKDLKTNGYNTDFIENSMTFYITGEPNTEETFFLVCK